ncbi:uncharacterized protein LOC132281362 [Cornus florida]|uniref:uncharacterized protein LOC132281362 n=1 Tax=Cornus florida TaxID=4283 RepID=UPI00289DE444|nr:uncharacterized protein LOC132281362 [Cornus florida]
MDQHIVSSCLKFLDTAILYDTDSTSWMCLAPAKVGDSPASHKWEDVLEMIDDLTRCLTNEKELLLHVTKLEVMKEELFQIKDVLLDKKSDTRRLGIKESSVQKKISKTLGHSSQCLCTLLLYYLYGRVTDIEVELRGGVYGSGSEDKFCLYMGKILTSGVEKMVWSGVKQLDRALELQGHLWCVGSEDRLLKYRGNMFFLRGISL